MWGNKERVKITDVGQPCRHCGTPVVKKEHRKPPKVKPGSYYFEWWLACPGCKALFMIEAAKKFRAAPVSKIASFQRAWGPPAAISEKLDANEFAFTVQDSAGIIRLVAINVATDAARVLRVLISD